MTVKVPIEVNKLDTWIDKNKKEFKRKSLRDAAIHLVQDLSKAKMDPKTALKIFIDEFLVRLTKFEATHADPKEKLCCRFYISVVTSYKTQLVKDDILIKSLSFERKSTTPIDHSFFLRVQVTLHTRFALDLRVAEQREKLFYARPISKTQHVYAKIYLNAPQLTMHLLNYFAETATAQLKTDWTNVVQVTPSVRYGISAGLNTIIAETLAGIEEAYGVSGVQKLGAIIASMLYQASITLNPEVNAFYALEQRGPVTRSQTRSQAVLLAPLPALVAPPAPPSTRSPPHPSSRKLTKTI